jgi:FdhD protein
MISKAGRLRVPIVISRTSPTSLAVEIAEQAGMTLIGYARGTNFRVYTHAWRIDFGPGDGHGLPESTQPEVSGGR